MATNLPWLGVFMSVLCHQLSPVTSRTVQSKDGGHLTGERPFVVLQT
jgi:hypothetical protein